MKNLEVKTSSLLGVKLTIVFRPAATLIVSEVTFTVYWIFLWLESAK
jgi:hypothetical protein